ncbi:MAG: c-type cytochrome [Planctomycetota bacterium]
MRVRTISAILFAGILCITLAGKVQGRPSWAIINGNSCSSGCHGSNVLAGKMQVSDTGIQTDLGTQLNGKVRGPLRTFRVAAGNVVTLSVDVLDGNDKFAVQLKRLEKGGQLNDQANLLLWSEANDPANVWTRQESGNPPYFTYDNGFNGGLSGALTPSTHTFDLLIHASTPPDVYDLEFATAGTMSGIGKWYQDEHFYVEVICPFDIAGDINRDCKVDFADFALMARNWLIDCLADGTEPGCGGRMEDAPVVRGGAMYDKWWAVAGLTAPTTDHPLWASRPDTASNTRTGADTWRCKECHGWDYKGVDGAYGSGSHRTGITGIFGTIKTPQEVFDLLKTGHAYGTAGLSDEDIGHLATFVTEGLIDTDNIINANGAFTGNVAMGQMLYDSGIGTNISCSACHGQLGLSPPPGHPEFDDYIGLISNKNPWEFQHKVQFGQPGTEMPGSFAGGGMVQDVADLGTYSQTLPQEPPSVPVARGGAMYDKWWAVAGLAAPTTDHPLWASRPDTASNTRTGADTWRCKECHGWDYKGVNGAYGSGSHRTDIAGIFGTTKTAQEVFDLLKTGHAYGTAGLSDEDIGHLATFVTEGLIDTDNVINSSGAFTGDVATGQTLYDSGIGTNISCSACHGQLGLDPPPGHPEFDDYVGLISNKNPWEFQHKVQFGQPDTEMPGSFAGGGTIMDVADVGAYSQTLPQEPTP